MKLPSVLIALMALSSCAPAPAPETEAPMDYEPTTPPIDTMAVPDTCGSHEYESLIGQNVSMFDVDGFDGPVRVLGATDIYTEDYRPERLNIFVDADGTILNMYCQ